MKKIFIIILVLLSVIAASVIFLKKTRYGEQIVFAVAKKVSVYEFKRSARKKFKGELHRAVIDENIEKVKKFISKYQGQDKIEYVNAKDYEGNTSLQLASWLNNIEIMEYLLKNGADINAKNDDNETVLFNVINPRKRELFWVFREGNHISYILNGLWNFFDGLENFFINVMSRIDVIPRSMRIKEGPSAIELSKEGWSKLNFLLGKGADVNCGGRAVLNLVALLGDLKLMKVLVEHGADVNSSDKDNVFPLHIAARRGFLDIIIFLFDKGANIHAVDKDGNTALHFAAGLGDVFLFLIDKGLNINTANKENVTPLGEIPFVEALNIVIENMDKDITLENIISTLSVACRRGDLKIVRYLLEKRGKDLSSENISFLINKTEDGLANRIKEFEEDLKEEISEEDKKDTREEIADAKSRHNMIIKMLQELK